jgi:hypothetical protein
MLHEPVGKWLCGSEDLLMGAVMDSKVAPIFIFTFKRKYGPKILTYGG